MLADADDIGVTGEFKVLDVPGVGTFSARRPRPPAVAVLAMASNPKADTAGRHDFVTRFVEDHLDPDQFVDLLTGMVGDRYSSDDAFGRVARALATWGTARPYVAVINLSVVAAHNWRDIRQKIIRAGVTEPMQMSSMHALLDYVESVVIEALAQSGEGRDAAKQAQRAIDSFYDSLYKPDPKNELNAPGYAPIPAGFSEDEQEDAFSAAVAAL
jgi:hypothetical protein